MGGERPRERGTKEGEVRDRREKGRKRIIFKEKEGRGGGRGGRRERERERIDERGKVRGGGGGRGGRKIGGNPFEGGERRRGGGGREKKRRIIGVGEGIFCSCIFNQRRKKRDRGGRGEGGKGRGGRGGEEGRERRGGDEGEVSCENTSEEGGEEGGGSGGEIDKKDYFSLFYFCFGSWVVMVGSEYYGQRLIIFVVVLCGNVWFLCFIFGNCGCKWVCLFCVLDLFPVIF